MAMRPPRGSTRSRKYIVDRAQASQTTGKNDFQMCKASDNTTLGQTSAVDVGVPVGAKIKLLDIRSVFTNISANVVMVYWSIQRVRSGQSSLDPISPGGNALTKNIMLSGLRAVGENQNTNVTVRYKIPKSMWRLADDEKWFFTTNVTNTVTSAVQVVYKVFV